MINAEIPVLMQPTPIHYEICLLCVAHVSPYDGQSSHLTFTETEILHIWVTQKFCLHLEPESPYEGQTSHPFSQLICCTSRLLHNTSRLP